MPKLTDKFISSFRPAAGSKDRLAFDTECRGLGIRATASGARLFLVQWTDLVTRKKVREPLGAWGSLTVDQARDAARIKLGKVAQGLNPKVERERMRAEDAQKREEQAQAEQNARFTLEKLVADWSRLHLSGKRASYAREASRAIRVAFSSQLAMPAAALNRKTVLETLDALSGAGKAPIAGRTLSYGRACYGWALKRGAVAANPFAGLPSIVGSAPTRDRVLTDAEIGAIWRASGELGHPFRHVVRVLLLTAQRREEVAGMRWSELSADRSTWTIPKERAKNHRAHVVHIAAAARAEIDAAERIDGQDLVFTVTGRSPPSGFSKAKVAVPKTIQNDAKPAKLSRAGTLGDRGDGWKYHDFRRTAVTWLAKAGFPPHVADRLLNHVAGSIQGVAAIYQRHDFLAERQAAIEAWAKHVLFCAGRFTELSNVVRLEPKEF